MKIVILIIVLLLNGCLTTPHKESHVRDTEIIKEK